jgi:hypothetical protein
MKNGVIFGILIVTIAAIGVAKITTILDNIIQNICDQIKKLSIHFPSGQPQCGQK